MNDSPELAPEVRRLLADIDAYCATTRTTPTQLGLRAINDGHLVSHLRQGRSITLRTLARVRSYLKNNRKRKQSKLPDEDKPPVDR